MLSKELYSRGFVQVFLCRCNLG